MMLLKHKQSRKKNREDKILISSIISQKQEDGETTEEPEELSRMKYEDEAKYMKLYSYFESKILYK